MFALVAGTVPRTVPFKIVRFRFFYKEIKKRGKSLSFLFGAGNRNRTGTDFTPRDFKSLVSTYSTMPADIEFYVPASCCGARHLRRRRSAFLICRPFVVPDILLGANTFVDYRPRHTLRLHCICHGQRAGSWPLPLAPLVVSATGGTRVAPRNRTGTDFTTRDFKSLVSTYSTMPADHLLAGTSYHIFRLPSSRRNPVFYRWSAVNWDRDESSCGIPAGGNIVNSTW